MWRVGLWRVGPREVGLRLPRVAPGVRAAVVPAIRLALARAGGEAGALEARVQARALDLGRLLLASLRCCQGLPSGLPPALLESTGRRVVERHTVAPAAVGAGRPLLVPPSSRQTATSAVDPAGRRLHGRPGIEVTREAAAGVVPQHVGRDRVHLSPVPVDDGEPKLGVSEDDREGGRVDPGSSRLEPADGGSGQAQASASSRWLRSAIRRARMM